MFAIFRDQRIERHAARCCEFTALRSISQRRPHSARKPARCPLILITVVNLGAKSTFSVTDSPQDIAGSGN
jgi:hypothetical protein